MSMTIKGVDTAATITQRAAVVLKTEGYSFIGRYLSKTSGANAWKVIKADEALRIRNAGLAILLIWETNGSRAKTGASAGKEDGAAAKALAQSLGVPGGVIYFAVDYDAPKADYDAIEAYLLAARAAAAPYKAGVYGPRGVVDAMHDRAAVYHFLQCVAWSTGISQYADVYQWQWQGGKDALELKERIGINVDLCRAYDMMAAGMWMPEKEEKPVEEKKPWYQDAMDWAAAQGLIKDGRPNDNVTRAELATVLYRALGPGDDKKDSGLLAD